LLQQKTAANNAVYIVNGDYVGTGIYYNKELFAKAGIAKLPDTWSELIEACKKLEAIGATPFYWDLSNKNYDRLSWWADMFYSDIYHDRLKEIDVDGVAGISDLDQAVAVKKGVFSAKDPKYLAFWPLLKDFSKYWQKGFTAPTETPLAFFLKGQVGMVFDGSWLAPQLKNAKPTFEYSVFLFPNADKASLPQSTEYYTRGIQGGPLAAFQYAVTTEKVNKTMTKEKEAAVMDWLMYITTPDNNSRIVNDLGQFIPTVVGAKAGEGGLEIWKSITGKGYDKMHGGYRLSPDLNQAIYRTFQLYILGEMDLEAAKKEVDAALIKSVDTLAKNNQWDLSKYIK
jgi:ABC-type glycerol-3-phosphate transport system substrate-binding protein